MKEIILFGKSVGPGYPTFIIAEVGLNHNGSVEIAKQLIDVAADAGCDAVKFQKRDVATLAVEATLDASDVRFPSFGATYRQIREHMEFGREEYAELMAHAVRRSIPFFATPFDISSAQFLESLLMPVYKVASHSLTNIPLLEYIAARKKPTIVSTGMATLDEVDQAVAIFQHHQTPLILLHCVSAYPTPPELVNLRLIHTYRERYGVPVGYSGHELASVGYLPTLGAVFLGAAVVERHITLDTAMEGFDHTLSVPPSDLKALVRDVRLVEQMRGTGEKKLLEQEMVTRNKYHVSIISRQPIPAGTLIIREMLTLKNPGTGIESYDMDKVVGTRAQVDIPADAILTWDMIRTQ